MCVCVLVSTCEYKGTYFRMFHILMLFFVVFEQLAFILKNSGNEPIVLVVWAGFFLTQRSSTEVSAHLRQIFLFGE